MSDNEEPVPYRRIVGALAAALAESHRAHPPKLSRAEAAARASADLRLRTDRRVQRTIELSAEHHTAAEIGRIIASEEGQREPFPVSTVKGWRRRGRGSKPTA